MSYRKSTVISGHKAGWVKPTATDMDARYAQAVANDPFRFVTSRHGHWRPEKAFELARRAGVVGAVEIEHFTHDFSGKGRGGYDRAFIATDSGVVDRPLTQFEREYDDGEDMCETYDKVANA